MSLNGLFYQKLRWVKQTVFIDATVMYMKATNTKSFLKN